MPGVMDTVLNLGLNDVTVEALTKGAGDERFAYDSYRRFITMYSNVVLGLEHHHLEELLDDYKSRKGYSLDTNNDRRRLRPFFRVTRTSSRRSSESPCMRISESS